MEERSRRDHDWQGLAARIVAFGRELGFGAVGIAAMLMGGNFLDYSVLGSTPVAGQHLGILLVEFGVGLTVASVMMSIFYSISGLYSPPTEGQRGS